jgi:hypothetical protein
MLLTVLTALSVRSLCLAQGGCIQKPDKITKVAVLVKGADKVTQLEIELQCAPDNMEPAAEPRSIRVDDRASVRFLLKNLSPLDVCTRTASPPTATTETPVAESLSLSVVHDCRSWRSSHWIQYGNTGCQQPEKRAFCPSESLPVRHTLFAT